MQSQSELPLEQLNLLEELIPDSPLSISEHELLGALHQQQVAGFEQWPSGNDTLALFRLHFLLFHLLYRLRDRLHGEQRGTLAIHCLAIAIEPLPDRRGEVLPVEDDPLRSYYLDLEELRSTGQAEVDRLLDSFFRQTCSRPERQRALAVLELDETASSEEIRLQYRRLAARHHPDRGGDTARAQEINRAMDQLRGQI